MNIEDQLIISPNTILILKAIEIMKNPNRNLIKRRVFNIDKKSMSKSLIDLLGAGYVVMREGRYRLTAQGLEFLKRFR